MCNSNRCAYCRNTKQAGCGCGAKDFSEDNSHIWRHLYAYDGFVVWQIKDSLYDGITFMFYLGETLIEEVRVGARELYEVEPGTDPTYLAYEEMERRQAEKGRDVFGKPLDRYMGVAQPPPKAKH